MNYNINLSNKHILVDRIELKNRRILGITLFSQKVRLNYTKCKILIKVVIQRPKRAVATLNLHCNTNVSYPMQSQLYSPYPQLC